MAPKDAVDIPSFAATQLALLEAELQSELSETSSLISNTSPTALQKAGLAITNLSLSSQRTGLGGKTVVELGPDSATASKDGELAEHGVRTVSPNFLGVSNRSCSNFQQLMGHSTHENTCKTCADTEFLGIGGYCCCE